MSAIPGKPIAVTFGAIASETATYDVGEICSAAECFRDYVIESTGATEVFSAIATLEVPVKVYLIALFTRESHRPSAAGRIRLRLGR